MEIRSNGTTRRCGKPYEPRNRSKTGVPPENSVDGIGVGSTGVEKVSNAVSSGERLVVS